MDVFFITIYTYAQTISNDIISKYFDEKDYSIKDIIYFSRNSLILVLESKEKEPYVFEGYTLIFGMARLFSTKNIRPQLAPSSNIHILKHVT